MRKNLSILVGLSLMVCAAAKSAESCQWDVFETSFNSTKDYTNAYVDAEVDAVFKQGERQWKVPAFWAGGNKWT